MKVFHNFASLRIHNAVVRLRQGFRLYFITAGQAGGTDFLRLLRIRFTPCQSTRWSRDGLPRRKKSRQISDGFWKSGGAEETRTLDPHTASVML